jgi:hypothetical protein
MPVSTQSKESVKELRKTMDATYDKMHTAMTYIQDNSQYITDQNLHWLKDTAQNFIQNINMELKEREDSAIG